MMPTTPKGRVRELAASLAKALAGDDTVALKTDLKPVMDVATKAEQDARTIMEVAAPRNVRVPGTTTAASRVVIDLKTTDQPAMTVYQVSITTFNTGTKKSRFEVELVFVDPLDETKGVKQAIVTFEEQLQVLDVRTAGDVLVSAVNLAYKILANTLVGRTGPTTQLYGAGLRYLITVSGKNVS